MITHKELMRILSYDPATGEFRWIAPRPKVRVGERAGYEHHRRYRYIELNGCAYAEHRLAWFYVKKRWPKDQIDHRDRDRGNNRFANLREATNGQNQMNARGVGQYGLKGIAFHSWLKDKPWEARIKLNGRQQTLGCYATKEEAHEAYKKAAIEHHGEFAHF